jgi:hypothetical protein
MAHDDEPYHPQEEDPDPVQQIDMDRLTRSIGEDFPDEPDVAPPPQVTAALYGLTPQDMDYLTRVILMSRDAEGYFLDTVAQPPVRMTAEEVREILRARDRRVPRPLAVPPQEPPP